MLSSLALLKYANPTKRWTHSTKPLSRFSFALDTHCQWILYDIHLLKDTSSFLKIAWHYKQKEISSLRTHRGGQGVSRIFSVSAHNYQVLHHKVCYWGKSLGCTHCRSQVYWWRYFHIRLGIESLSSEFLAHHTWTSIPHWGNWTKNVNLPARLNTWIHCSTLLLKHT